MAGTNVGLTLPANELAIAAYYDGNGAASSGIQVFCPGSGNEWIVLTGLTAGLHLLLRPPRLHADRKDRRA